MVTAFKYLLGGKLKKADEAPTREEQLRGHKSAQKGDGRGISAV